MIWDDVGSNLDSDDSVIFSSYQLIVCIMNVI